LKHNRKWGKKKILVDLLMELVENPLEERMSLRQLFYQKIPYLEANTPDWWRQEYKNWGQLLYDGLCEEASDLFLEGRFSYQDAGIIDNSGANEYIYQNKVGLREQIPPDEECVPDYPVEIWVENNATFNALIPLFHWVYRDKSNHWKINIVSGKGFTKSQQIEEFEMERADDVQYVFCLNDFDPAGVCMATEDLPNRFKQRGLNVEVEHIGIFPEQIPEKRRGISLTTFKGKLAKRFIEEYGKDYPLVKQGYGYELQALTPSEIRQLVLDHLETYKRNGLFS